MTSPQSKHCVAVIGGSTAGAEVAHKLAEHGVIVIVIEQNPRPFGKIEDGLPRWHEGLRSKEFESISRKLSHPNIHFVPNTRIGRDIDFAELASDEGLSAVVLACGAWRDRPLPVEGADDYIDKGLTYQNPFVISFNHMDDPSYEGRRYPIVDGSLIVGGGLASIDVAKIHTLECTRTKLAERGIETSIVELEVKGIPRILAAHGLRWEDLGLEGCTIFYRRRLEDMPLTTIPEDATPEQVAKAEQSRLKILAKASEKFMLKIEPLCMPDALIVENDRLVGLRFRRTRMENGRVVPTDETFERRGNAIVSSIGSIPEPIPGIDMRGELFDFTDWDYGRLAAYPSVFAAGNVVTGKGNIVASRKHASHVYEGAIEQFLGIAEGEADAETRSEASGAAVQDSAREIVAGVIAHTAVHPPPSPDALDALLERIRARQKEVGYTGDFASWIESVGGPP